MPARFVVITVLVCANVAQAAEIERWQCDDHGGKTVWTIVENRMFTAKGRSSLQVIHNSPALTLAYLMTKSKSNDVISRVYALDKTVGSLIVYDDMLAAITKGRDTLDPTVEKSRCVRVEKDSN